jgi:hypothetical protein
MKNITIPISFYLSILYGIDKHLIKYLFLKVLIAVPGPLDSLLGLRLRTLVTNLGPSFKKSSLISIPNSRIDDTRSTEMTQYEKQFTNTPTTWKENQITILTEISVLTACPMSLGWDQ